VVCGLIDQRREEEAMKLARVVSFEGVDQDRVEQAKQQMSEGRPDDIPATEIVMLHDADAEKSVVILFFENEDDYNLADATLGAMAAEETPGRRTSVGKFEVAVRTTA
jgi:hypothetical protein